jgi:uncharacterized membrane protein YphA (DoxX/SURF4 family)
MNGFTRFFLILLRLAIGWHFFVEGMEKIQSVDLTGPTTTNRPWSSAVYLREASGPAAKYFHRLAGDPDEEALALFEAKELPKGQDTTRVSPRDRISQALDQAWNAYLENFRRHYQLTDFQNREAGARMDQAKEQAVLWLLGQDPKGKREVEKSFNGTASVKVVENSLERLNEYRDKVRALWQILDRKLPAFNSDVEKQRISVLKAETARLRNQLLADLELPMKEALDTVLTDEQKKEGPILDRHTSAISDWKSWTELDWVDAVTRYGLTVVGACLVLGLFTRTACLGGAAFLLLFYLAMPSLPWVPANPRAEGHYLFINKNIIEMLALLTLATTRSGRWVGLDGLLYWLMPWHWGEGGKTATRPPASR